MAERARRPGPGPARIASGGVTRLALWTIALAAAALPAPAVLAQADAPNKQNERAEAADDRPELAALVARLDDPALGARERASSDLQNRAEELERFAENPENIARLSPEQRARVASVLRQRFFQSPRAGLGVSFEPTPDNSGVRINRVLENFPVSDFLEVGDVLERARGIDLAGPQTTRATTTLRYAILSLEPGETLEVAVRRDGETVEMEIPTGSYAALGNPAAINARMLENAWRVRERRLGLVPARAAPMPAAEARRWNEKYAPRIDVPGVLPAGRPAAEAAAAAGAPTLARDERDALSKRDLVIAERLRLVQERLKQTGERLVETMDQLQTLGPNDQRRDQLESQIRSLRLQIAADQRLSRQLRTRLAQSESD